MGYFLGTYEYAAPEQIQGTEIDNRADIYALGCVLFECLSGEAPFAAQTEGSVIHSHLSEPPPKLTTKRPDLPVGLNDVIATAMAKAKEDRYQTCSALVRALRAIAAGGTVAGETIAPAAATIQGAAPTILGGHGQARTPVTPTPMPTSTDAPSEPPAQPPVPVAAAGDGDAGRPRTGERRTVEVSGGRIFTVVLVLLVLIAAAVIAAVLLTRHNNSSNSSGTQTGAGTTASGGNGEVAIGLKGVVPNTLMKQCKVVTPTNGASQEAACTPPAHSTTFWPDNWSFSLYPSTSAALAAYNNLRKQNGVGTNFGRCDRTAWAGEGAWLHNPEPGAQPKPGGRRFCYFQGNVAVIVWLHEKLAQTNHIDMIGMASAGGSDHFNLYGWYRFWHHTVGKCLAPNCVARLS
jgi:preprotein translocase subunit SecG